LDAVTTPTSPAMPRRKDFYNVDGVTWETTRKRREGISLLNSAFSAANIPAGSTAS
jgi:hypothetical protein